MKIRATQLLSMVMLYACSTNVFAEPSSSVQYLMNEPASLFDFGMKRLDEFLSGRTDIFVITEYNYDQNRILISVRDRSDTVKSKGEAKERCAQMIGEMKTMLGVGLDSTSVLGSFFSHEGYTKRSEPKNLGAELDSITVIIGRILHIERNNNFNISCESPLTSPKVMYSE